MSIENEKSLPRLFDYPGLCGEDFEFGESGMQYIKNVIVCDKMYRLIKHANYDVHYITEEDAELYKSTGQMDMLRGARIISYEERKWIYFVNACNLYRFLAKFLDDPNCPNTVKAYIYYYVGRQLGAMKKNAERCGPKYDTFPIYQQRSFLTERWMETCR